MILSALFYLFLPWFCYWFYQAILTIFVNEGALLVIYNAKL